MPSTRRRRKSLPDGRVPAKPTRTIRLAHSPDADDAFMFWALAAGKIDTGDRRYEHELADIETLNRRALSGELEVTAVSLHAYAGLLIHEGQLTYGDRGLHLWLDLGEWWYQETGGPLPLGGNVVRRDLGAALMHDIARDLRASIQYALEHRPEALAHAQAFSRGLDVALTDRFVGMYVNAYTVDYGPQGRRAVTELLERAERAGLVPGPINVTFIGASS